MRKFRKILYIVYFVFHIVLLGAVLYVNHELGALFSEFYIVLYIAILGMILFFIDLIIDRLVVNSYESRIRTLEAEKNEIKAKLYDRSEASAKNPPTEESSEEQL